MTFAAPNIPQATSEFYVNDFANVFTEKEESALMERAVDLANTSDGIQIVVTTITSLDGNTVEDYANSMYNQYGIGKNDMGILILLATEDRQIRVEVGKNMEAYINDSKAGRFMDKYAIPKLKENKFSEGLISLQTELIREIKNSIQKNTTPVKENVPITIDWGAIIFGFILFIIIGIIGVIIFFSYRKSCKIQKLSDKNNELRSKMQAVRDSASIEIANARNASIKILNQKEEIEKKYFDLITRLNILEDRYNRGIKLHPNLNCEIDAMIEEEIRQNDIAKASSADSIIQEIIDLPALKENLSKFENALLAYNSLNENQQSYVKSDISKLNTLYQESKEQKNKHLANIAIATITGIISGITVGKEKHIKPLKEAKEIYDNLSSETQQYVEDSIPEKITSLLKHALHDKKQREEREEEAERRRREEARRRRNSYTSSYTNRTRSSFGGFGGHSGGGGASRGF